MCQRLQNSRMEAEKYGLLKLIMRSISRRPAQLVAGPIERTRNLLPQIEGEHTFHTEKVIRGSKMIAWGFFKKIAIEMCFRDKDYY